MTVLGDMVGKHKKVILIGLALALVVALHYARSYIARRHFMDQVVHVRPENFPAALVAPDGAAHLSYSSPSTADWPGVYWMSYTVEEEFPAKELRSFIDKRLQLQGWKKLKFDLLNPQFLRTDQWMPQTDEKGVQCGKFTVQEWVNAQGESVSLTLSYGDPPINYPDGANVWMAFYEGRAWPREFLIRYKQQHPQEFWSPEVAEERLPDEKPHPPVGGTD